MELACGLVHFRQSLEFRQNAFAFPDTIIFAVTDRLNMTKDFYFLCNAQLRFQSSEKTINAQH